MSDLNLLGATTVTIEVPKGEKLESAAFNVKATERGKFEHFLEPVEEDVLFILYKEKTS